MDIFDTLHGWLDIIDDPNKNKDVKTTFEWATKSANAIILISDKEKMREEILRVLEEAYVRGAEAQITPKDE